MGKKDLVLDPSLSILLTVPEDAPHQEAAQAFLLSQAGNFQPFFFNPSEETVTIDLVRALTEHSSFARASSEPQAIIICAAHTATLPAQNALLKLVEEPPPFTQLILVAQPGHQLLPTLISRCREILWTETSPDQLPPVQQQQAELARFLQAPASFSYPDLIALAESLKDKDVVIPAMRAILREQAEKPTKPLAPNSQQALLSTLTALANNGNVRLVLEHYFFALRQQALKGPDDTSNSL